jgi:hypothetical protein
LPRGEEVSFSERQLPSGRGICLGERQLAAFLSPGKAVRPEKNVVLWLFYIPKKIYWTMLCNAIYVKNIF